MVVGCRGSAHLFHLEPRAVPLLELAQLEGTEREADAAGEEEQESHHREALRHLGRRRRRALARKPRLDRVAVLVRRHERLLDPVQDPRRLRHGVGVEEVRVVALGLDAGGGVEHPAVVRGVGLQRTAVGADAAALVVIFALNRRRALPDHGHLARPGGPRVAELNVAEAVLLLLPLDLGAAAEQQLGTLRAQLTSCRRVGRPVVACRAVAQWSARPRRTRQARGKERLRGAYRRRG